MIGSNKLIRVAFVSHSADLRGAEKVLANFVLHLDPKRILPIVILPGDGPVKSIIAEAGIACFNSNYSMARLDAPGASSIIRNLREDAVAAEELATLLSSLEVDLVVVNTGVIPCATVAAARSNLPCILWLHGVLGKGMLPQLEMRYWRAVEASMIAKSELVLVPSSWVKAFYQNTFGLAPERTELIPNGTVCKVDYSVLHGMNVRKSFVELCSLEPNKNVAMFLAAARKVLARSSDPVEFHIYGDGPPGQRDQLCRFISRNGLSQHCHIHSRTAHVSEVYDSSYGVVVTSEAEAFSLVTIEAMSRARPVISTKCGGPEEIISDGKSGFLVERGDPGGLAERMTWLLDNPSEASAMGAFGRKLCEERYDVQKLARTLEEALLRVVEDHSIIGKYRHGWQVEEGLVELLAEERMARVKPTKTKLRLLQAYLRTVDSLCPSGSRRRKCYDAMMTPVRFARRALV